MKTSLISLIALSAFAAMAAAEPVDRTAASGPMVLSDAELDGVTAGVETVDTLNIVNHFDHEIHNMGNAIGVINVG